jgi:hypothetical protein
MAYISFPKHGRIVLQEFFWVYHPGIVNTSPKDPRLFELFSGAIETALEYVHLAKTGKTHIGKHDNWPELRWHEESGLPWVTSSSQGPENYADAVQGLYSALYAIGFHEEPLDFTKEKNFVALVEYVKTQPRLLNYLGSDFPNFGPSHLQGMVANILDRYINVNKTNELDSAKLLPIYLPMEAPLFGEVLPIIVVVPILFLKFGFPQFQLSKFISIETISDELHLARGWRGSFGSSDNSLVESAATHALFIRDRCIENESWFKLGQKEMSLESYPIEEIDTFFAAVRIATGYPTGYAEMLTLPVGWASSYAADLTPVDGPTVENYPPFFKKGYWQQEVPTVNSGEADAVRQAFEDLQQAFLTKHARKIQLAMSRLNLSSRRTTDEDGIIDAMIAMEALLSDGTQEMTHKVSMRLAGLYKIADHSRTEEIFMEMKRIYAFRSKIVHGEADLDKHREITRRGIKISAVDAAVEHLRCAFAVLIKHRALLNPTKIDKFLLTDKLHEDAAQ